MPLYPVYCDHGTKRRLICQVCTLAATVYDPKCKDSKRTSLPHVPCEK